MLSPDTPAGEALAFFRRPKRPPSDFALFETSYLAAPTEMATVEELAREIHAARGKAPIQLIDDTLLTQSGEVPIVSVYRFDDGSRSGLIGHAFLKSGGSAELKRALERQKRDRRPGQLRLVAN